jgi:hypothetical protein
VSVKANLAAQARNFHQARVIASPSQKSDPMLARAIIELAQGLFTPYIIAHCRPWSSPSTEGHSWSTLRVHKIKP